MSANDHTTATDSHDDAHTGPIKTPKQLLAAVFFSFVIPIFAIIGLVYYVTSANKTAPGAVDTEKAVAMRIQKVGSVEIRDANRALKSGEEVYKAQCTTCHAAGLAGSPKFGDAAAWGPRIKTGGSRACFCGLNQLQPPASHYNGGSANPEQPPSLCQTG